MISEKKPIVWNQPNAIWNPNLLKDYGEGDYAPVIDTTQSYNYEDSNGVKLKGIEILKHGIDMDTVAIAAIKKAARMHAWSIPVCEHGYRDRRFKPHPFNCRDPGCIICKYRQYEERVNQANGLYQKYLNHVFLVAKTWSADVALNQYYDFKRQVEGLCKSADRVLIEPLKDKDGNIWIPILCSYLEGSLEQIEKAWALATDGEGYVNVTTITPGKVMNMTYNYPTYKGKKIHSSFGLKYLPKTRKTSSCKHKRNKSKVLGHCLGCGTEVKHKRYYEVTEEMWTKTCIGHKGDEV